jgi:hypothetical protein
MNSKPAGGETPSNSGISCLALPSPTDAQHAKKLQPKASSLKIVLTKTTPPVDPVAPADHLARLRRRFGRLGNG